MLARHREILSASVFGVWLLGAVWAAPTWANEVAKSADGQAAIMQTSERSAESGAGEGQIGWPTVSDNKRNAVTDPSPDGVDGMVWASRPRQLAGGQILSAVSLFGVDFDPRGDVAPWLGAGRVGHSYYYSDTRQAFSHSVWLGNGLQVSFGSFAPTTLTSLSDSEFDSGFDQVPISHFESELSYSNTVSGTNFKTWIDSLWHDASPTCFGLGTTEAACNDNSRRGWGIGSTVGYLGFELVGYFQNSKSLGLRSRCNQNALWSNARGNFAARKSEGYFVQGSYALNGKTKVGVSYSEGSMETSDRRVIAASVADKDVGRQLWTVGVYHDVSSWLRLMAEYNRGELNSQSTGKDVRANAISVGTFLYW